MKATLALLPLVFSASTLMASDGPGRADARPSILFAIADDWSWPHAGSYGDKVVRTPTFDRIATAGVLFTHAFCTTPSCTPSRGAILTGQTPHRLAEGGNLWSTLPKRFAVYPDILEAAGYVVGCTRKGWGPGNIEAGGRTRNPAGPRFKSFQAFLRTVPEDKPFCFWFGSTDPHRPYEKGSGREAGMKIDDVAVPPFLPDTPEVRSDILDYCVEVQRFDRQVGELLERLEAAGRTDNTIVVVTSDNGMPFPRAKTNLYDSGTRMPLAVQWPAKVKSGRRVDEFISFTDFAPTFLQAAGLKPPPETTGRSFLDVLAGEASAPRDRVYLERERHANSRPGNLSYPVRAIRTREFLYIRNLHPDRWPAGDPDVPEFGRRFGDIDDSPSKDLILTRRSDKQVAGFFQRACAKRPAEELYDLSRDPAQMANVAGFPDYANAKKKLRAELDRWMRGTGDPRAAGDDDRWDRYPYYGRSQKAKPVKK